jgi:hypothetical protein
MAPAGSWRRFLWPELLTRPKAKDAAREGAWAMTFLAAVLFVLTTLSLWSEQRILGLTEWYYLDAGVMAVIAFGLFRLSRVAAVAGLVVFILGRLAMGLNQRGYVVALIFFVALVNGVRGTFAYHRLTASMQKPAVRAGKLDQLE